MEPTDLPIPILAYFNAHNVHDIDAVLAVFDENAIVVDEEEEHRGRSGIRAWLEDVTQKYHATVEPKGVKYDDKKVVVSGLVSGDFPGSPVLLDHTFTLDGDSIAHLVIH